MLRINYVKNQHNKYIGYISIGVGIFLGLITLLLFVDGSLGYGIFFGIIAFVALAVGVDKVSSSGKLSRYVYLIENGNTEIGVLANLMNKPEREVFEDIERYIESGIFFNTYLNKEKMRIEEIQKKTVATKTRSVNGEDNKKEMYCSNCGARLNEYNKCEYCGED